MYKVKPGQLVEVEWLDPAASSHWVDAADIICLYQVICHSVGWVHLTDEDGIILTACYCEYSDANDGQGMLFRQHLPWGCITQIWILES